MCLTWNHSVLSVYTPDLERVIKYRLPLGTFLKDVSLLYQSKHKVFVVRPLNFSLYQHNQTQEVFLFWLSYMFSPK